MNNIIDNQSFVRYGDNDDNSDGDELSSFKRYDFAPNEYWDRLNQLDNGLSEEENARLEEVYADVLRFGHLNESIDPEAESEWLEKHIVFSSLFFVKAKGNPELASRYYHQYSQLMEYSFIDFDRIFCKENGFPDPDVPVEDVATNDYHIAFPISPNLN